MRTNLLFAISLLIASSATNAQLTILPQVGFERSSTNLQINNLESFSPMDARGTLKANIRADYKFKGGHGPFAGFGTSPATVAFKFTDPANAVNNFKTATNNLQWRLEGGYQYTSSPIYFKKKSTTASSSGLSSLHMKSKYRTNPESSNSSVQKTFTEKRCGSYSIRSQCEKKVIAYKKKDERLNMRIQPSVGMAYRPSVDESFEKDGNTYQYNAGNWKSAVISGLAFELAKGSKRQATVGVHYTKGLIDTETLNTVSNSKPSATDFRTNPSSWAVTVGIPISLAKKQVPVKEVKVIEYKKMEYKSKCGPKKVYI